MRSTGLLFSLLLTAYASACQSPTTQWEMVVRQFTTDYEQLQLAPLRIAYIDNLRSIQSGAALDRQTQVFHRLETNLAKMDRSQLTLRQQLEYDLLHYYLQLNKERIELEQAWLLQPVTPIPESGLASLPNGKAWYAHFLKRWIDRSVNPEDIFEFGLSEIGKVQSRIRGLQQQSGMDSLQFHQYINSNAFFYEEASAVQQAFEDFHSNLITKLPTFFPGMSTIPAVAIERGTDQRLAQVPGFYRNSTFYYNVFDRPFNKRQIAWLYLHEALPGHHYEGHFSPTVEQSPLQQLFHLPGYKEGWAAYVEEIGGEIGAYQTWYDELGKWEWDLIRSVRVPLDVGLNYYGWTDTQALEFWRRYIRGKDDIGQREIDRMKRWPCQVITYKYGADKILKWKNHWEVRANFELKRFHERVLQHGPLPFSLLEGLVLEDKNGF